MKSEFKVGDRVFIKKECKDYAGIYAGTDCEVIATWSAWVDVKAFDGREFSMPPDYIVPYNPTPQVCSCGVWVTYGKVGSDNLHTDYCDLGKR